MILDLHQQGLSPTAIARQLDIDRKTVRKYIARGMEPPNFRTQPRRPRRTDDFLPYPARASGLNSRSLGIRARNGADNLLK